jgi:hypothetical protein
MYPSLVMRLREGLLHRARGGHDHLTSIALPAGCTIKPPDAGSRQCPWVAALLKEQLASSTPSGSWPKLTPTGQHAWPDTNRSSGACSNACDRTGSNRSATRSPRLQIRSFLCGRDPPVFRGLTWPNASRSIPRICRDQRQMAATGCGRCQTCDVRSASISPGQDEFSEVRAEGVGFEPTVTLPPQWFSRPSPSATRRALLRITSLR